MSTDAEIDGRRDETEEERLDRNMAELLNELRVALPGVQVLFAFLLGVPFTQRFADLAAYQEDIYYGAPTVVATAATAFAFALLWYGMPLSRRRQLRRLGRE